MSSRRIVVVPLTASRAIDVDPVDQVHRCLRCGGPLELHQPVIEEPDRLIGICLECRGVRSSWHVIDLPPSGESGGAVIVLLPDAPSIEANRP
jgi:hypothetical protein